MPTRRDIDGSAPASARLLGQVARGLLGASLLSVTACGGDDAPVFTKLFTTEHFEYYVEQGVAPPCDATGEWLERYYSANAKFMGATLPPGEKIDFYLAPGQVSRICPFQAPSCAKGTTIHSDRPVHPHEIVHANASLVGSAPALFAEGLAMVLGCVTITDIDGPIDLSAPIESLVETQAFDGIRGPNGTAPYYPSASFVRYLIDRFGASRFLSFYARAPRNGVRQEIEAVFQAEMGVPLDDAFSDWRTKPPPYGGDLCIRLMECDSTMLAPAHTEVALGCGPMSEIAPLEAVLPFEVPKDRIVHLTTEPISAKQQDRTTVFFFRCSGGDVIGTYNQTSELPVRPGESFALDVPPGEYVAWFQSLRGSAGDRVRVDIAEQMSPMRSTACEGAEQPLALNDQHPTVLASRWIDRPCQGPWCPGQSWDVSIGATGGALEAQVVDYYGDLSPGAIYICSEPCPTDASQCEILDLKSGPPEAVRSKQTFAPGAVVHLGASAAPFADRFAVQLRLIPE